MKKVKSLLLMILASCTIFCTFVSAANIPNITFSPAGDVYPISSTTRTFNLNTQTGRVLYEGSVDGTEVVTKCEVSAVIQRYQNGRWTDVPGSYVSNTRYADHASFDATIDVSRGYEYRMEITYAVTARGTRYVEVHDTDGTIYF